MISLVRAFGIIEGGVALVGATAVTGLLGLSPGALAIGVAGKLSEYTKIVHTNIFEGAGAAGIGCSLLAQSMSPCVPPLFTALLPLVSAVLLPLICRMAWYVKTLAEIQDNFHP